MKNSTKFGFTLAEVLITLGIIGIVAQMTIPALMKSTEKQANLAQLKKFYSSFNQGMKMYMQNEGCSDLRCTGAFVGTSYDLDWQPRLEGVFGETFKGIVSCDTTSCLESVKYLTNQSFGNWFITDEDNGYSFSLADGALVQLSDVDGDNCAIYVHQSKITGECANIVVDVNGKKLPNKAGRDIFRFVLAPDANLYPFAGIEYTKAVFGVSTSLWTSDSSYCGTAGSAVMPSIVMGIGCAARIMENGWNMDY